VKNEPGVSVLWQLTLERYGCNLNDDRGITMRCTIFSLLVLTVSPLVAQDMNDVKSWRARTWPEAEAMFHQDRRWLGSDGAYSLPLDSARVLWLFGDTFISTSEAFRRSESVMIRNSIGIQEGADPSNARMTFHWKTTEGRPSSFIPEEGEHWFWFGDGRRVGRVVMIALARMRAVPEGLGFSYVGPHLLFVPNPDDPPDRWTFVRRDIAGDSVFATHFPSALHSDGTHVYAFVTGAAPLMPVRLLRWPVRAIERLNVQTYQWWDDSTKRWYDLGARPIVPHPIFAGAQAEFTVQRHAHSRVLTLVQSVGFGATSIGVRWAQQPEGPWTDAQIFHHPIDAGLPGAFLYAAKSHAHLTGAPVICTYAANNFEFTRLIADTTWYYPRVLKVIVDSTDAR